MSSIRFRRALSADAEALAVFAGRTFRDAFAIDNTADDIEAYTSVAFGMEQQLEEIEDPKGIVLIAERADEIVGYAHLRENADAPVYLERFYVEPSLKGRGLAQELMTEVIAAASARGASTIRLGVWERNPRAIAFYLKCGFERVGTQTFVLGIDAQTDLVMEKRLGVGG